MFKTCLECCCCSKKPNPSILKNEPNSNKNFKKPDYDPFNPEINLDYEVSPLSILPENICKAHKLNLEFFISDPNYKKFSCTNV